MTCSICGGSSFSDFGGRARALCDGCHALERHRALAREMADVMADGGGRWALEAGPLSPQIFGQYLRDRGWNYVGVDRWRTGNPVDPRAVGFIDRCVDLADMRDLPTGGFDLFLAQHVIEEIEDYQAALAEIARVLGPGGRALMEIPFRPGRPTTRAAENRYGNVWDFGDDLIERVAERFAAVDVVALREEQYAGQLLVAHVR
jgi:SAM-dependent methyltransferase